MKKAVLITGASSGIGKACAIHLDNLGYKIYAGVRKEEDGIQLQNEASKNLVPVILDVTKQETITQAFNIINQDRNSIFYGLVNNAGISGGGVLEAVPEQRLTNAFNVNVFGIYRVTQTFLPILRKNHGRIINIGSLSGYMITPGTSVYCASKFAVRALTNVLRIELKPFDIKVSQIVPGAIDSKIWDKSLENRKILRANTSEEIKEAYSLFVKAADKTHLMIKPAPAILVAKKAAHALGSKRPKYNYYVGKEAGLAKIICMIPSKLYTTMVYNQFKKLGK